MTGGTIRRNGLHGAVGIPVPELPSSEGHVKHTSTHKANNF